MSKQSSSSDVDIDEPIFGIVKTVHVRLPMAVASSLHNPMRGEAMKENTRDRRKIRRTRDAREREKEKSKRRIQSKPKTTILYISMTMRARWQ